jgi:3-dehydroquinate synthase
MAADLSMRRGDLSSNDFNRVVNLLARARLPTKAPQDMTDEQFIELMGVDKKVLDGRLRLVLLTSLGRAIVTSDIDKALLLQTFSACR